MEIAVHQHRLLSAGRCGRCAERISRPLIVRRKNCPHCASVLYADGASVLNTLDARATWWRLVGYGLVGVASFFAGVVPLLQAIVQIVALLVLHVFVLRRKLVWMSPGRRLFASLTLKTFGAVVTAVALLINVAIAPFLGVSAFRARLCRPGVDGGLCRSGPFHSSSSAALGIGGPRLISDLSGGCRSSSSVRWSLRSPRP